MEAEKGRGRSVQFVWDWMCLVDLDFDGGEGENVEGSGT